MPTMSERHRPGRHTSHRFLRVLRNQDTHEDGGVELRIEILSLIPTSVVEVRLDGHQDKRSFMMMGTARYRVSPGRHTVSVVCGKLSTEFEVDVTEDCAQNVNVGLKGIKVGGSGLPQLL